MLESALIQLLPNSTTAPSQPNLHCSMNRGELPTLTEGFHFYGVFVRKKRQVRESHPESFCADWTKLGFFRTN